MNKTPGKSYMLPLERSISHNITNGRTPGKALNKTPGKGIIVKMPLKGLNKTPAKAPPNTAVKKLPISAIKSQSFITPSKANKSIFTSVRRTDILPRINHFADTKTPNHQLPKQSMGLVDDTTFSLMNCSTSTELESTFNIPGALPLPTAKIISQQQQPMSFSPLMRKIESTIDEKMKSFFTSMQNFTAVANETVQIAKKDEVNKDVEIETLILDDSSFDVDDTVRMFEAPSCSTVIRPRVTQIAKQEKVDPVVKKCKLTSSMLSRTTVDVFAVPLPPKRRNVESSVHKTNDNSSIFLERPPVRRSNRISMMTSLRETTLLEASVNQTQLNVTTNQRKKREPKQKVKNEVVASYFGGKSNVPAVKVTKESHQKAILDVFNTGTFKELQNLPTIGLKSAYQIVSYRCLNGKFKTIEDIKKVPIMVGKKWDKFLNSNMLQSDQ
ncbi:unnamed protein product [Diamesa serratosioi]